jgi:hypothetical protein
MQSDMKGLTENSATKERVQSIGAAKYRIFTNIGGYLSMAFIDVVAFVRMNKNSFFRTGPVKDAVPHPSPKG